MSHYLTPVVAVDPIVMPSLTFRGEHLSHGMNSKSPEYPVTLLLTTKINMILVLLVSLNW